jgi:3'-5' exonuclease
LGQLTLEAEQQIVGETKTWLTERAEQVTAFRRYLDRWGDWPNPWEASGQGI